MCIWRVLNRNLQAQNILLNGMQLTLKLPMLNIFGVVI